MSRRQQQRTLQPSSEPSYPTSVSEVPSESTDLVVRAAQTESDAVEIHKLMMLMGNEVDLAPVNPIKTMKSVLAMIEETDGRAILMATRGGSLLGVLGLVKEVPWFSDQPHLQDRCFYVHPLHRNEGVGAVLIEEGRCIADATGMKLYIDIRNTRRRRGSKGRHGTILMFEPRT